MKAGEHYYSTVGMHTERANGHQSPDCYRFNVQPSFFYFLPFSLVDIRFGSCSRSYRDLLRGQIENSYCIKKARGDDASSQPEVPPSSPYVPGSVTIYINPRVRVRTFNIHIAPPTLRKYDHHNRDHFLALLREVCAGSYDGTFGL